MKVRFLLFAFIIFLILIVVSGFLGLDNMLRVSGVGLFIFLAFLLLLVFGLEWWAWKWRRRGMSEKEIELVRRTWQELSLKISADPARVLIEADKLLDFVLMKKGYQGSFSEKLKQAQPLLSYHDEVWAAHKLRNRAVHEVGFFVAEKDLRRLWPFLQMAFKDLGINNLNFKNLKTKE